MTTLTVLGRDGDKRKGDASVTGGEKPNLWVEVMERLVSLLAIALLSAQSACFAGVVCDEAGWNEYGTWSSCLKYHREPGTTEGRRPVDANRVGQVEKVHKNLDGSVTVWRHGSSDTEEWTQTDKDTWERKR